MYQNYSGNGDDSVAATGKMMMVYNLENNLLRVIKQM
jgi:hypothetical protein